MKSLMAFSRAFPFVKSLMLRASILAVAISLANSSAVSQESKGPSGYPSKLVKIIVPTGPGGNADLTARLLGEHMSKKWGQPVVIENRPGAANRLGVAAGAKAHPDGYTLTVVPVTQLVLDPHNHASLPYDVFRDLAPVSLLAQVQNVLVVGSALGIKTAKDLVQAAKAKPDDLTFGVVGVGSIAHIASEILNRETGIKTRLVPYNSISDGTTGVLRGDITMMFTQLPTAISLIESGQLQALGVASFSRSPFLPNVPTIGEALGIPPFETASWSAFMAPGRTPADIRSYIAAEVAEAFKDPKILERLKPLGAEPVGSTPDELARKIRSEYDRYGEVLRRLNIRVQ